MNKNGPNQDWETLATDKNPADRIGTKTYLGKRASRDVNTNIYADTDQGRKFFHDLRATENVIKRLCAYRSWPRRRYSFPTLSLSIFNSNNFSIHTPITPPEVWVLLSIVGALNKTN